MRSPPHTIFVCAALTATMAAAAGAPKKRTTFFHFLDTSNFVPDIGPVMTAFSEVDKLNWRSMTCKHA